MKTVANYNFKGKKALVRVDFNVPLDAQFHITDNNRIVEALPTLRKILDDGGTVVLMSHLGRPKSGYDEKFSLKHLLPELSNLLNRPVKFVGDCVGSEASTAVAQLAAGEVLLLENLRFHSQEEKGDLDFAQQLAELGCDVYVNDAFGTAHRAHASTAVIAQFFSPDNRLFGLLMEKELRNAARLQQPARPYLAILGGAKVSDKILLIEKMLDKVDALIIGGGMAYTFALAQGGSIGKSLVEPDKVELALQLLEKAKEKGVQLLLPIDSVVADAFSNDAHTQIADTMHIPEGYMGLDIGIKSQELFSKIIAESKTIFWNGPMGVFEMPNFQQGTKSIAQAVVQATEQGAYSLVGGGDSAAAIKLFGFDDEVSYISTGGGAMLELLEGKTLPGVAAVES